MPVWPFAAYTAAIIGLILRLAQPTAICFGLAGLVRGPSTLNTHGTPSAARIGPTKRIAGWKVRANANAMPHSLADFSHLFRRQIQRQSQRFEAIGGAALDEAARLPCLTILTPAAAATIAPMDDRFTVDAPSPPVPTISVVSPSIVQRDGVGRPWPSPRRGLHRESIPAAAGGEHRADGGRIGVAVREVINEPLRIPRRLSGLPPTSLVRIDFHVISAILSSPGFTPSARLCFRRIF